MAALRPDLESTAVLLDRIRTGDGTARERLFARVLPALHRWAHRRLPAGARDLADTADVVQVTVGRALARLEHFEHRGEGAFLGYLRQILLNVIRGEQRRAARRPLGVALDETMADPASSLLERTVDRDTLDGYERALSTLSQEARERVGRVYVFLGGRHMDDVPDAIVHSSTHEGTLGWSGCVVPGEPGAPGRLLIGVRGAMRPYIGQGAIELHALAFWEVLAPGTAEGARAVAPRCAGAGRAGRTSRCRSTAERAGARWRGRRGDAPSMRCVSTCRRTPAERCACDSRSPARANAAPSSSTFRSPSADPGVRIRPFARLSG